MRTASNFDIITKHLYSDSTKSCQNNEWQSGLAWLASYTPEPPPFRTTLLPSLKFQLEDSLLDLLTDIIKATNALKCKLPSTKEGLPEYDADVIAGQLIYLFEQLVLAPTPHSKKGPSLNQTIRRRIRLFRSGHLDTLHQESRTVISGKHRPPLPSNHIDQQSIKSTLAQRAADNDDFKKAIDRLLKATPIAPNTEENIEICQQLHPEKLPYVPTFPSLRSHTYTNPITFTPDEIVRCLRNLKKGKATGIQGDSLDIFTRLVQRRTPAHPQKLPANSIANDLAIFFSHIANANFGEREREHINTIYFVAFHKDVKDPKKLRPIGVPCAVRRITANLLITKNKPDFASYLLPYNYAIGVRGGISTIVHTMRIGVDKYITEPLSNGALPTRALVSLDIRNMFNAVSRHKLREIIALEFPHLLPFTDMLYKDHHIARFKDTSGTWQEFHVEEGFTQGCPLSPLFAGIVLTHILKQLNKELHTRAKERMRRNNTMDDESGGLPIIMAYVDDTNCLLPLEDVNFFLTRFKELGEELGAIMNTDKTRIMTSTSGSSILPKLRSSNYNLASDLESAIAAFSTKNSAMYEETEGLRILGSPIGSLNFQQSFISSYLDKLRTDAHNLLHGLEDEQTIIQLYRQCTSQRLNHLFPSDIHAHALTSTCDDNSWHCWDSPTAKAFDSINSNLIKNVTMKDNLPLHSAYLLNIPTTAGGLGFTSPRYKAIPASILAIKGTLDTIYNGIHLSTHRGRFHLPAPITSLYDDRTTNTSSTLRIFNKFGPSIAALCTGDTSPAAIDRFIHMPLNTCHDIINNDSRNRLKTHLLDSLDEDSKHNAAEICDGKLGQGLLDLPRSEKRNRQCNKLFRFNLLRCLRLNIWETTEDLKCPICHQDFDTKGDHLYQCKPIGSTIKKSLHNKWRDMWKEQMKKLIPFVGLTDSKIEHEKVGLVRSIPNSQVRPFDTHFNLPQTITNESYYRCKLNMIGFDMNLCHADTCPPPSRGGRDAKRNCITTSLILAEKEKFQRGESIVASRTCRTTGITVTGEQIIGDLFQDKKQLLPFVISPLGLFGPTINHFLYGITPTKPSTLHNISQTKFPNAFNMAKQAFSPKTPSGILQRADSIWLKKQPQYNYGGSYRSPTPSTYYTQMFGREVCFANGSAGLTALQALYSGNHNGPLPKSSSSESCFDEPLHSILNCTDESSDSRSFQPTLSQLSEHSPNTCLTLSPTT